MRFALVLAPYPTEKWNVAAQLGVGSAVVALGKEFKKNPRIVEYSSLKAVRDRMADVGIDFTVVEGDVFPLDDIKLGLPGGKDLIDKYCQLLQNLGDLGISTVCYNFMAGIGWLRTTVDVQERGGALTTRFSIEESRSKTVDIGGVEISEEKLWDNYFAFLDAVLPVAEKAGVMLALHPDDPPISPVMGVPRIITELQAFDQIFEAYPSPNNGMTFCQACFRLMTADSIYKVAEKYVRENRIFFVHFRDVKGDRYNFTETFHDNGPTDMARLMRIYQKLPVDTPIRPDHAPVLAGEDNEEPGYGFLGKVYALGYMKGILDSETGRPN